MRNSKWLMTAVLSCVVAAPATARLGSDPKALEILAAARKAIGETQLDAMKTFSAEAKVQRNVGEFQLSSDVELFLELPDKYLRSENMTGGPMPMNMTVTSGFNDATSLARGGRASAGGGMVMFRMGHGGASSDMSGQPEMSPEQREQAQIAAVRAARAEISRLMLGWFASAHPSIRAEYTYVGQAESPDGKADVIDVKGADGFAARLFVDAQTRLPLMLSYQAPKPRVVRMTSEGRGEPTDPEARIRQMENTPPEFVENRLYFADRAAIDGIKVPRLVQRSVDGTTQEEWTIGKVKVNPRIDAKKFESER